jgi:hypothetical protein
MFCERAEDRVWTGKGAASEKRLRNTVRIKK